jgi:hypothetical protein
MLFSDHKVGKTGIVEQTDVASVSLTENSKFFKIDN